MIFIHQKIKGKLILKQIVAVRYLFKKNITVKNFPVRLSKFIDSTGEYLIKSDFLGYSRYIESLVSTKSVFVSNVIQKTFGSKEYLVLSLKSEDHAMLGGAGELAHPLFVDGKLQADGIVLVHAHQGFPKDGMLYPNNYYGDGPLLMRNPRSIVEFSFNGLISSDRWNNADVIVLMPLQIAPKNNLMNLWYIATSYLGPVKIPQGATILVRSYFYVDERDIKALEARGIHVKISSYYQNADTVIGRTLDEMGYESKELLVYGGNRLKWRTSWKGGSGDFLGASDDHTKQLREKQFKMLAAQLGIRNAQGTLDYDLGRVTGLMEYMYEYFITKEKTLDPFEYLGIKVDSFLGMVDQVIKAIPEKDRDYFDVKKLKAFADFYVEIYRLQRLSKETGTSLATLQRIEYLAQNPWYKIQWNRAKDMVVRKMYESSGASSLNPLVMNDDFNALVQIANKIAKDYGLAIHHLNRKGLKDRAMKGEVSKTGGIDLRPANMNVETKVIDSELSQVSGTRTRLRGNDIKEYRAANAGIKFHLDPAMLQQLQNASGFVPTIISVRPITNLKKFLGVT